MNSRARAKPRSRQHQQRRPERRRLWIILAAVVGTGLVAFAIALGTGIAMEGSNAFCASCHTQPEQTYYQRTQQTAVADLASLHVTKQVRCIDCHSGNGFIARSSAVLFMGARDGLAYFTGHYTNPAVTTQPLGSDSCTKCHDPAQLMAQSGGGGGEEGSQRHYHNPQFEAAWQQAGGPANPCSTCHPAHPQIGTADTLYTSQDVAQTGCEKCHAVLRGG